MVRRRPSSSRPSARTLLLASGCGWLLVLGLTAWDFTVSWRQLTAPAHQPEMLAQDVEGVDLATISPAAGDEGGEGGGEAKTSFNGKKLTAGPTLPVVTVGGMTITTYKAQTQAVESALLPAGLRDVSSQEQLIRRFHFTPYAHDASRGPIDAPVMLIAFNDLACEQCRPDVKLADTVYTSNSDVVRQVDIHLPLSRYSDTNLLAFYGKVAQRAGKYWEYRQKIMDEPVSGGAAAGGAASGAAGGAAAAAGAAVGAADPTAHAFEALMACGIDEAQARDWLTREARRYYRELDADAALAKSLGLDNPPHFYLNGIHLGEEGLPRDKVAAVGQWLLARRTYRLDDKPLSGREPIVDTSVARENSSTIPSSTLPGGAGASTTTPAPAVAASGTTP